MLRGADVLIDSTGADHGAHPHLVTVDLSWFGRSGPYRDFKASDAVCRALAGFVQLIGPQEGPPLTLPDYQSAIMGGLAAFIPAMAALLGRQSRRYEVSVHEATIALAEYQAIEAWATGTPQKRWGFNRFTPTYPMGVYRCKQGWIGITIVTPAQWKSFCDLLGMPDLGRHPQHVMGTERLAHADALEARFVPRFLERTAEEWFAAGLELRLPFAIVPDMKQVLEWPVFRDRQAIVPIRMGERTVEAPGSPFHLTRTPANFGGTVPELGEHDGSIAPRQVAAPAVTKARPLEGLRIIDLSMGWAGPICTRNLADLGADVIKIEACGYPDWWRGVDNRVETVTQRLYEKSSRFNIMNRGKRAITLDLTVPDGVALAKALVKDADAVIENYSAEVLRKFGLDYAELAKVNPSLVMVSMAAFGGSGPWRETRAYGSTLEQGSGLPSVGGRADDPPMMNHLAYGDAVGGLNACSAMLVALLHRRETGEGQFIDLSQVQCMLPFTAAWAIEQSGQRGEASGAARRQPPSVVRAARRLSVGRQRQVGVDRRHRRRHVAGPGPPHRPRRSCARHGRRPPRPGGSHRGSDRGLDGDAFARRGDGEFAESRRGGRRGPSSDGTARRSAPRGARFLAMDRSRLCRPSSAALAALSRRRLSHRSADACRHARPVQRGSFRRPAGPFQSRAGAACPRQRHRQRSAAACPAQGAGDDGIARPALDPTMKLR